ncbi:unnamed protein product [Trichogramma brassicae]|uniref:Uncharacterized protein n=1 Tax=Trichogramma brassicae TaxID=86971 RepID=A0A6H5IMJ1_9HYME|nr:unnamed protein product [Trichogramma brassicae]
MATYQSPIVKRFPLQESDKKLSSPEVQKLNCLLRKDTKQMSFEVQDDAVATGPLKASNSGHRADLSIFQFQGGTAINKGAASQQRSNKVSFSQDSQSQQNKVPLPSTSLDDNVKPKETEKNKKIDSGMILSDGTLNKKNKTLPAKPEKNEPLPQKNQSSTSSSWKRQSEHGTRGRSRTNEEKDSSEDHCKYCKHCKQKSHKKKKSKKRTSKRSIEESLARQIKAIVRLGDQIDGAAKCRRSKGNKGSSKANLPPKFDSRTPFHGIICILVSDKIDFTPKYLLTIVAFVIFSPFIIFLYIINCVITTKAKRSKSEPATTAEKNLSLSNIRSKDQVNMKANKWVHAAPSTGSKNYDSITPSFHDDYEVKHHLAANRHLVRLSSIQIEAKPKAERHTHTIAITAPHPFDMRLLTISELVAVSLLLLAVLHKGVRANWCFFNFLYLIDFKFHSQSSANPSNEIFYHLYCQSKLVIKHCLRHHTLILQYFLIRGDSIYGRKTLFLRKKVPGTQRVWNYTFEGKGEVAASRATASGRTYMPKHVRIFACENTRASAVFILERRLSRNDRAKMLMLIEE